MRQTATGSWRLLRIAWGVNRTKCVTALFLMVSAAVAGPALAACLGAMTNALVAGHGAAAAWYGGVVALLAVVAMSFGNFAHVVYFEMAELAEMEFVERLMALSNGSESIEHHERSEYAGMLTVLQPESRRFPNALQSLFDFFGLLLAVVFTAVLLARVDPLLLLLPLAAVPPLWAGGRAQAVIERAKTATATATRGARGLFQLSASPRFGGELRVFDLDREMRSRHAALWEDASRGLWRANTVAALLRAAGQLVFGLAYIGAVILVIRNAVVDHRGVGEVILVITLATQVNQQVSTAVTLLGELQRMTATLRRLDTVAELVAAPRDVPADLAPPERLTEGIRLEDVGFTYTGAQAPALREVSLTLPAGTVVAVVGENGAGKSTLVKLLCGLYRPSSGRILVDGEELRRIPVEQWRERASAGFQDFVRYELAAGTTVGLGDVPRIDDTAAVRDALERAQAADVIERLPDGLDTLLGRSYADGAELSGGQWQKLALGRALMRQNPLLLVLDEPTAALDPEAEHRLFERYAAQAVQVAAATGGITLLVSHRFSTVRMADLIVVVDDGRIVESGDHASLMAARGLYADLFELQAGSYR
ncbi:ABC transporter ATP-binding protein [Streptomyces sp. V4-01]|uniref:ABC transporter ATP-binding protein n=1 Tax=Actinacidiphila polyblastidii TaxID=3110430 RepID=A0ABU7PGS8_9ACTN|nr:ABC transporter ATP-binding protein [Streptomyces sp. V4-01]